MNPLRQELLNALQVEKTATGFRATLHIAPTLSILADHFPNGNPILPGICMIQATLLAAAKSQNLPTLHLRSMSKAKFLQPVLPNDTLLIEAEVKSSAQTDLTIKAKLSINQTRAAEFSLIATTAEPHPNP